MLQVNELRTYQFILHFSQIKKQTNLLTWLNFFQDYSQIEIIHHVEGWSLVKTKKEWDKYH